ncbi:4-hydroxybenzoate 3-monooxygenase [Streptomyces tateyamensis]|uniref:4-hydroxybenzoate 3-monooxygenase n=1 Tax=Streptomyces tateyamensis TaxID=565073 RepID=A0A2V4NXN4_9ACTN|nr:4-hydroxybenzoate 3-monooxygenase [Streptomyces tateyamensis]PYC76377.1 4-hydroxybenzoate 3-monooxygenase [Streptomyces tateyamensis]
MDQTRTDETTVLIVGAGPAGLVLGNLLLAAGVDCLLVEHRSRAYVEQRARAGFLAANTVRVLRENGLAAGLLANSEEHDTCAFRTEEGEFQLAYGKLGRGEVHTVYPQQFLVTDLVAEFLARGGDLRFETAAVEAGGLDGERVELLTRAADGSTRLLRGQFLAGCDGRHGFARTAVPTGALRRHHRDHGVSWLALLAGAPQSMSAITYAVHQDGFAGHMARSPQVTRYYLQVPPGTDPADWSEERVWAELAHRMRAERYGALHRGPILERRVINMASDVQDPMQYGRLFLVGDAASLISPSAAKGANLAVMAAETLAHALVTQVQYGDEAALRRYSADCLPRVWRAQEFSHWMIGLLHGPAGQDGDAPFLRELQQARLANLRDSRRHQDQFAQEYVGI